MPETGKYCCFACPAKDYGLKRLSDPCPTCGRPYDFPLRFPPESIGSFRVLKALGRGFYAATYVAEKSGPLRTKHVLKVSPREIYAFFGKDFTAESSRHAEVADQAEHIVGISDVVDADVRFLDLPLSCHVAVLDYLDGDLLSDFLSGRTPVVARVAAQVSADLFRLTSELEQRLVNHNDLHASNIIIQRLTRGKHRQGAMDPSIRAVAIDLGSTATDRRSGGEDRGDLHWVARHVQHLADGLLANIDGVSDQDGRVAHALQAIAQALVVRRENQRTPSADDLVRLIEEQYFRSSEPWRPWRDPLVLRTFGASSNAQTLEAWHVPRLLVDPDGTWLAKLASPGPLIMTGMRGCGKTLLLRAAQFHARAVKRLDEEDTASLARLRKDGYVGLLVSAQRLLNVVQDKESRTLDLFPRLFVAYALEASRAMAHLSDMAPDEVVPGAQNVILSTVLDALCPRPEQIECATIEQLERQLGSLLVKLSRTESGVTLASHPSNAFPALAGSIRESSPIWRNAQVLFLLDDVSTRYVTPDRMEELLSALIFQNPSCAFKVTSEAQAIFLSLKSPGLVNPAAHWRDFATFDLGEEVNRRLKNTTGKKFVDDILRARSQFFAPHPKIAPSEVLGDVTLESIAETIACSKPDSNERKRVYRGLSALSSVCVGDIGSIITIYENILARSAGKTPVPESIQNEVFQNFCSSNLYQLDRRGSHLKDVAQSFAEAAHELLLQSSRPSRHRRLRQYASLYVRVTTGDIDAQMTRLRELVDAGVFVFTGGTPRTKTRDSSPMQQFKLTYRKIYGLVNFIGLSERDRFELSGKNLEDWIKTPADGKAILKRNLATDAVDPEETSHDPEIADGIGIPNAGPGTQSDFLLEMPPPANTSRKAIPVASFQDGMHLPVPTVSETPLGADALPAGSTLIVGLGFEERTALSAERVLDLVKPSDMVAISYAETGFAREMLAHAATKGHEYRQFAYSELADGRLPDMGQHPIIDVTGLAKPAIFHLVRATLAKCETIHVIYTAANGYYPLESDLAPIIAAERSNNHHRMLASLKSVLTGELPPYRLVPLLGDASDGTRLRALFAFGSPKHERLMHLAEERDYDVVRVLVSSAAGPRSRVSEIAAEYAVRGRDDGVIQKCDTSDLAAVLAALIRSYEMFFLRDGLSFEVGLTGNKLETVAAGILSSVCVLNQAWYVAPEKFDPQRFTTGTAASRCFRIDRPPITR